jgi:hypothetical protein
MKRLVGARDERVVERVRLLLKDGSLVEQKLPRVEGKRTVKRTCLVTVE